MDRYAIWSVDETFASRIELDCERGEKDGVSSQARGSVGEIGSERDEHCTRSCLLNDLGTLTVILNQWLLPTD
jgi:hypothetical protein